MTAENVYILKLYKIALNLCNLSNPKSYELSLSLWYWLWISIWFSYS